MSAWTRIMEPGPTLIILVLMLGLQIVNAAPFENEQSTEIEYYPVADATGCYYNFEHYDEGDRIITNEPCLNCTCHNRMLMCYLRVCPFTKAIGQDCKVEKKSDQCCPVITCPEVPVHLVPQVSTPSTALGHLNEYGCSIDNLFYADGAKVPSNPNNPCEVCYCIRNKTACIIQECTLTGKVVEGCRPVYVEGVCCPLRYDCDHPEIETTPKPLLTSTTTTTTTTTTTIVPPTSSPSDCIYENQVYIDGALVKKDVPCEKCYCMRGDIICAVQECGPTPLDKVNCTALPTKQGQCCPDTYDCEMISEEDLTTLSYYDVPTTQPSIISAGTGVPAIEEDEKVEKTKTPVDLEDERDSTPAEGSVTEGVKSVTEDVVKQEEQSVSEDAVTQEVKSATEDAVTQDENLINGGAVTPETMPVTEDTVTQEVESVTENTVPQKVEPVTETTSAITSRITEAVTEIIESITTIFGTTEKPQEEQITEKEYEKPSDEEKGAEKEYIKPSENGEQQEEKESEKPFSRKEEESGKETTKPSNETVSIPEKGLTDMDYNIEPAEVTTTERHPVTDAPLSHGTEQITDQKPTESEEQGTTDTVVGDHFFDNGLEHDGFDHEEDNEITESDVTTTEKLKTPMLVTSESENAHTRPIDQQTLPSQGHVTVGDKEATTAPPKEDGISGTEEAITEGETTQITTQRTITVEVTQKISADETIPPTITSVESETEKSTENLEKGATTTGNELATELPTKNFEEGEEDNKSEMPSIAQPEVTKIPNIEEVTEKHSNEVTKQYVKDIFEKTETPTERTNSDAENPTSTDMAKQAQGEDKGVTEAQPSQEDQENTVSKKTNEFDDATEVPKNEEKSADEITEKTIREPVITENTIGNKPVTEVGPQSEIQTTEKSVTDIPKIEDSSKTELEPDNSLTDTTKQPEEDEIEIVTGISMKETEMPQSMDHISETTPPKLESNEVQKQSQSPEVGSTEQPQVDQQVHTEQTLKPSESTEGIEKNEITTAIEKCSAGRCSQNGTNISLGIEQTNDETTESTQEHDETAPEQHSPNKVQLVTDIPTNLEEGYGQSKPVEDMEGSGEPEDHTESYDQKPIEIDEESPHEQPESKPYGESETVTASTNVQQTISDISSTEKSITMSEQITESSQGSSTEKVMTPNEEFVTGASLPSDIVQPVNSPEESEVNVPQITEIPAEEPIMAITPETPEESDTISSEVTTESRQVSEITETPEAISNNVTSESSGKPVAESDVTQQETTTERQVTPEITTLSGKVDIVDQTNELTEIPQSTERIELQEPEVPIISDENNTKSSIQTITAEPTEISVNRESELPKTEISSPDEIITENSSNTEDSAVEVDQTTDHSSTPTLVHSESGINDSEYISKPPKSPEETESTEKSYTKESEITVTEEQEHGIPGEGNCLVDGKTYENNSNVPPFNQCQISCKCISSILQCESVTCMAPPSNLEDCMPIFQSPGSCCPTYSCSVPSATSVMESDSHVIDQKIDKHETTSQSVLSVYQTTTEEVLVPVITSQYPPQGNEGVTESTTTLFEKENEIPVSVDDETQENEKDVNIVDKKTTETLSQEITEEIASATDTSVVEKSTEKEAGQQTSMYDESDNEISKKPIEEPQITPEHCGTDACLIIPPSSTEQVVTEENASGTVKPSTADSSVDQTGEENEKKYSKEGEGVQGTEAPSSTDSPIETNPQEDISSDSKLEQTTPSETISSKEKSSLTTTKSESTSEGSPVSKTHSINEISTLKPESTENVTPADDFVSQTSYVEDKYVPTVSDSISTEADNKETPSEESKPSSEHDKYPTETTVSENSKFSEGKIDYPTTHAGYEEPVTDTSPTYEPTGKVTDADIAKVTESIPKETQSQSIEGQNTEQKAEDTEDGDNEKKDDTLPEESTSKISEESTEKVLYTELPKENSEKSVDDQEEVQSFTIGVSETSTKPEESFEVSSETTSEEHTENIDTVSPISLENVPKLPDQKSTIEAEKNSNVTPSDYITEIENSITSKPLESADHVTEVIERGTEMGVSHSTTKPTEVDIISASGSEKSAPTPVQVETDRTPVSDYNKGTESEISSSSEKESVTDTIIVENTSEIQDYVTEINEIASTTPWRNIPVTTTSPDSGEAQHLPEQAVEEITTTSSPKGEGVTAEINSILEEITKAQPEHGDVVTEILPSSQEISTDVRLKPTEVITETLPESGSDEITTEAEHKFAEEITEYQPEISDHSAVTETLPKYSKIPPDSEPKPEEVTEHEVDITEDGPKSEIVTTETVAGGVITELQSEITEQAAVTEPQSSFGEISTEKKLEPADEDIEPQPAINEKYPEHRDSTTEAEPQSAEVTTEIEPKPETTKYEINTETQYGSAKVSTEAEPMATDEITVLQSVTTEHAAITEIHSGSEKVAIDAELNPTQVTETQAAVTEFYSEHGVTERSTESGETVTETELKSADAVTETTQIDTEHDEVITEAHPGSKVVPTEAEQRPAEVVTEIYSESTELYPEHAESTTGYLLESEEIATEVEPEPVDLVTERRPEVTKVHPNHEGAMTETQLGSEEITSEAGLKPTEIITETEPEITKITHERQPTPESGDLVTESVEVTTKAQSTPIELITEGQSEPEKLPSGTQSVLEVVTTTQPEGESEKQSSHFDTITEGHSESVELVTETGPVEVISEAKPEIEPVPSETQTESGDESTDIESEVITKTHSIPTEVAQFGPETVTMAAIETQSEIEGNEKIHPVETVTDLEPEPVITESPGGVVTETVTRREEETLGDKRKPEEEEGPILTTTEATFTSSHFTTEGSRNGSQLYTSGPTEEHSTKKSIVGELSTSAPTIHSSKPAVVTTAPIQEPEPAHEIPGEHEHVPDLPDYQSPVEDYDEDDQSPLGPGTCRYGGKVFVSAQQIPRDDPCDFCFCFRSDIICLQQSCPPPIPNCHEEPIRGFCCPRYECPVGMATSLNLTTTTTTTTTTLPPHFLPHAYKGMAIKNGCQVRGQAYRVGDYIKSASGPCMHCTCGADGRMKCDPKQCSPEPMLRQMIAAAASRRRR